MFCNIMFKESFLANTSCAFSKLSLMSDWDLTNHPKSEASFHNHLPNDMQSDLHNKLKAFIINPRT